MSDPLAQIRIPWGEHDLDVMARTVRAESRGEPTLGQIGVAWVIRTRAEVDLGNDAKPDWWGETIAGVCLKPWQFSCWNANDPNRAKIDTWTEEQLAPFKEICLDVLNGRAPDPTGSADHYFADYIPVPTWAKPSGFKIKIGRHLFYRLRA